MFDFCIVPEHDFTSGIPQPNVFLTRGALNRIEYSASETPGKLILLGGPSKTHGWDGEKLLKSLTKISEIGRWTLTDSRRTPTGFIEKVRKHLPQIECFPNQQTTATWLPEKLQHSDEVWVTEDSVSMVYEALSSGARIGLLPIPRLTQKSRTLAGLERLIEDSFLTPFHEWEITRQLCTPPETLREAGRCADWLSGRLNL
jgi:mitochondrial fission protein ELM1